MAEVCPICEGSGLRLIERADGSRAAQECACRAQKRTDRLNEQAHIPKRHMNCSLENFEVTERGGENSTLRGAKETAQYFVENYPILTDGRGLLLTGPNGTGKTHLAVGITKALLAKGAQCLFVTYGDLLKQVQNSYNPTVRETELEVLRPVIDAEVLVIDELGSSKPSDWVWDTVAHILNTRYNDVKTTIITTNFANERELLDRDIVGVTQDAKDAWLAMYKMTLGDRIGERMRSRLLEMCRVVHVVGSDFRDRVSRPSINHTLSTWQGKPASKPGGPPLSNDMKNSSRMHMKEPEVVGAARLGRHSKPIPPRRDA